MEEYDTGLINHGKDLEWNKNHGGIVDRVDHEMAVVWGSRLQAGGLVLHGNFNLYFLFIS